MAAPLRSTPPAHSAPAQPGGQVTPSPAGARVAGPRPATVRVVEHGAVVWVDIRQSDGPALAWLRSRFGFHPLDIEDLTTRSQRPKLDVHDEYLLLVLHFPVYDRQAQVSTPSEVHVFLGADYLVTVHDSRLKPVTRQFDQALADATDTPARLGPSPAHALYRLLDQLGDYLFPILNKVGGRLDTIESRLFEQTSRLLVYDISLVRRDIIALRRMLRPMLPVMARLEGEAIPQLPPALDIYWGNIHDHLERAADILADYQEVIDGLAATSESLATRRTNDVVRALTIISTIMLPLAVISGIYGMNIAGLPFAGHPWAAVFAAILMIVVVGGMLALFKLRRWI